MDGGAWWAAVHGVTKRRTRLSDFPFIFHFHALEKEMATHSRVPAWRIPGTGEPGGLPPMGSHRVGHNGSNLAAAAASIRQSQSPSVCAWVCVCVRAPALHAVQHVGSQFCDQGLNPCPLQGKCGVWTTGPLGKFPISQFTPPSLPPWQP